jgi:sulfur carrier protein
MFTIEFNGQPREVDEEVTVADLLRESRAEARFCAVEINLEILPKDQYATKRLREGDRIEIVTLVGGG